MGHIGNDRKLLQLSGEWLSRKAIISYRNAAIVESVVKTKAEMKGYSLVKGQTMGHIIILPQCKEAYCSYDGAYHSWNRAYCSWNGAYHSHNKAYCSYAKLITESMEPITRSMELIVCDTKY